tara:strand:- start:10877 stop:11407 length:531 start_codon:yes stop_codon:yes gene_type:complete
MSAAAIKTFAQAAEAFCAFIDSFADARPRDLYRQLESHLAQLHATIVPLITSTEMYCPAFSAHASITPEQRKITRSFISTIVLSESNELHDWHLEISGHPENIDNHSAIRASMLWDDLADIYADLSLGLIQHRATSESANVHAAWEWKSSYESHWGYHLFRASSSIHELRYQLDKD